jgi:hypothetical protein
MPIFLTTLSFVAALTARAPSTSGHSSALKRTSADDVRPTFTGPDIVAPPSREECTRSARALKPRLSRKIGSLADPTIQGSRVPRTLVPADQMTPCASEYIARSTTISDAAPPRLSTTAPNPRPAASRKPTVRLNRPLDRYANSRDAGARPGQADGDRLSFMMY